MSNGTMVVGPTSAVDPVVAEAMAMSARLVPLKNALNIADLTDQEMDLFAMVALRMRLDPFQKQVYAIKRKGKVTFQVGIDGFRSSAEETGEYRGSSLPDFGPIIDKPFPHPEWAQVFVHRQYADGSWLHQPAKVWWDEFYPGDDQGFQWRKMGRVMLSKCAEAAGFRMAFPRRFGGVYVTEEMQQAEAAEAAKPVVAATTHRDRIAQQRAAIQPTSAAPVVSPADQRPVQAEAAVTEAADAAAPTPAPDAVLAADGAGVAVTTDGEVIEGTAVDVTDGLSAGDLRQWLRENLIGISEARAAAKGLFAKDELDKLTDAERGALRRELERKAGSGA